jgi:hypothetical protein
MRRRGAILVLDNDRSIAELLIVILGNKGHDVRITLGVRSALAQHGSAGQKGSALLTSRQALLNRSPPHSGSGSYTFAMKLASVRGHS